MQTASIDAGSPDRGEASQALMIDEVVPVKDADAVEAARHRARQLGPGKKVVTVIVDTGLRYLNGGLFG
ncbi:hypothetical protein NBZ79_18945 [Sneathiella marina]|uniref:Tryptophan synthase beta chain-like PALP domain-containing protein n=1 Tax=Sneathiella marina TaxID=2950108 RepID=A0ABY4W2U6_9PROT|nr:hypothetical protein [Sneathiella marina]USG61239.1 hypothetical protein NBZ79_18945 [Sneathiella marina]